MSLAAELVQLSMAASGRDRQLLLRAAQQLELSARSVGEWTRTVERAVAAESERCARVCEHQTDQNLKHGRLQAPSILIRCAAAIRSTAHDSAAPSKQNCPFCGAVGMVGHDPMCGLTNPIEHRP